MAHKSSLGSAVFSGLSVEEVTLGQEGLGTQGPRHVPGERRSVHQMAGGGGERGRRRMSARRPTRPTVRTIHR